MAGPLPLLLSAAEISEGVFGCFLLYFILLKIYQMYL